MGVSRATIGYLTPCNTESCAHGCYNCGYHTFLHDTQSFPFFVFFFSVRFYIQIRVILNTCSFYSRLQPIFTNLPFFPSFLVMYSMYLCSRSDFSSLECLTWAMGVFRHVSG